MSGTYCECCKRDCNCEPMPMCELCHKSPQEVEAWFRRGDHLIGRFRVCCECAKKSIAFEKHGEEVGRI
jgi:hypothetical protein